MTVQTTPVETSVLKLHMCARCLQQNLWRKYLNVDTLAVICDVCGKGRASGYVKVCPVR